jgi:hypothetical protein
VYGEALSGVQFNDDELAATVDASNAPAGQRRAHLIGIAAEDARAMEFGGQDAPAHDTGDGSRYGFDFR